MKKLIKSISVLFFLVFAITACSQLSGGISSQDLANTVVAQVETDMSQKYIAPVTVLPTAVPPVTTPVVIVVYAPTNTPMPQASPTYTPYPYYTYQPTAYVQPCAAATAVDYNYPDNTSITGGYSFTKGWTFTNVGYCTWDAGYYLQFTGGESMGASTTAHYYTLGSSVLPNSSINVSVALVAPASSGTHTGYWGLYTSSGAYIGQVWVTINVNGISPTSNPAFQITSATTTVSVASGHCVFTAQVTATTAGTATYYWVINNVTPPALTPATWYTSTYNIVFPGASTIPVYWTAPDSTYPTTVYLYNYYPNHQGFTSATSATCP